MNDSSDIQGDRTDNPPDDEALASALASVHDGLKLVENPTTDRFTFATEAAMVAIFAALLAAAERLSPELRKRVSARSRSSPEDSER